MSFKKRVGKLQLKSSNLFEVDALIEWEDDALEFPQDIVFFSCLKDMKRDTKIVMQVKSIDLRDLSIALEQLYYNKESDYRKYTQSNNSSSVLSLNFSQEIIKDKTVERYYINMQKKDLKISVSMNKINILSFSKQCEHLAFKLEEKYFIAQGGPNE